MADVYATLADGGWRNTPIAITKVVFPDGHVDSSWGTPHRVKVLCEGVTAEETSILHENVESGTATRSAIDCPTAAKTGTTSELVDAWLDGYTPHYSTVVWMGYPNKRVSMTDVHGEPQQGGYLPAEIWHAYMAAVTEGQTCARIPAAQRTDLLPAVLRQVRAHRASRRKRAKTAKNPEQTQARTKQEQPRTTDRTANPGAAGPARVEERAAGERGQGGNPARSSDGGPRHRTPNTPAHPTRPAHPTPGAGARRTASAEHRWGRRPAVDAVGLAAARW